MPEANLPLDRAALVGCGVLTGVGAALRWLGLEARADRGGVRMRRRRAVEESCRRQRVGGARQIMALDQFDTKLDMASTVGATHLVNSSAVRTGQGRRGPGRAGPAWITPSRRWGIRPWCAMPGMEKLLAIRGTATIVGVLPPDAMIEFPSIAIRQECCGCR